VSAAQPWAALPSGQSVTLPVTVNASGLAPGHYTTTMHITTTASVLPSTFDIPITLTVT
jgi:hypothetical protein